jgi:hypothetical protein
MSMNLTTYAENRKGLSVADLKAVADRFNALSAHPVEILASRAVIDQLRAMPIPAILSKRLTGWRLIPCLPIIHEPFLAEGAYCIRWSDGSISFEGTLDSAGQSANP